MEQPGACCELAYAGADGVDEHLLSTAERDDPAAAGPRRCASSAAARAPAATDPASTASIATATTVSVRSAVRTVISPACPLQEQVASGPDELDAGFSLKRWLCLSA